MKFSEPEPATPNGDGPRTLASVLVRRVRDDIVAGALAPGAKLRLPDLSERYRVGINPLREALARLSSGGLVRLEDQKGFSVSPVSREDLLDLTRVRIEIECLALRQSIADGDVEWEARVIAAHHRLARMSPTAPRGPRKLSDGWEAAHQDFHLALVSGCKSRWLEHFHTLLAEQSARYRRLAITVSQPRRDIPGEHAKLLAAVLARDADKACDLIAQHFTRTTDIVLADKSAPRRAPRRSKR